MKKLFFLPILFLFLFLFPKEMIAQAKYPIFFPKKMVLLPPSWFSVQIIQTDKGRFYGKGQSRTNMYDAADQHYWVTENGTIIGSSHEQEVYIERIDYSKPMKIMYWGCQSSTNLSEVRYLVIPRNSDMAMPEFDPDPSYEKPAVDW